MTKATYIFAAIMGVSTAGAGLASFTGAGLTQPEKQPMGIREGSVRRPDGTWGPSVYFLRSGGIHGGK